MKMRSLVIASAAVAALTIATGAQAVPTCEALSLYANAAESGLCRSLTPTTQNHWVCELADGPDIHTTFNAATHLHITVRQYPGPNCQGHTNINGTFPANMTLQANAPICHVSVQNYLARLNAVNEMAAAPGQTHVQTAILAAVAAGRVTAAVAQTYVNTAAHHHCP